MQLARLFRLAALAAASFLLAGSPSRAAIITLPSDLGTLTTPGNSAVVGDKTFTFLSYQNTQNPSNGGNPIDASSINVTPLSGNPITTPYGFELSGPIAAIPNTFNGNDILLQYTVTSSGAPITAVNLVANGNATGDGFVEIVESIFENINGVKGALLGQIFLHGAGSTSFVLDKGYTSLFITKDIQFSVLGQTGTASYSLIDQTFVQSVPEPASVAMAAMGLGLFGIARLRRKAVAV